MQVDPSDLQKVYATLVQCERHFKARDQANAAIHLGEPIFSPLTTDVFRSVLRMQKMLGAEGIVQHARDSG